jgi:hypothetical protein
MSASLFLPAARPAPEWPRRRLLAALVGSLMVAGGVVAGYEDKRIEPVRGPGPRRYPPGYRKQKPAD